jgi:hypothetical protein
VITSIRRRRDHVGVTNMGGGIDGWRIPPHIVNCSLVVFTLHAAVPVTALNTKEFAR